MPAPAHILVIRFSAMGDVAMTVPVLKNLLQQNPHLQITVVSNAFFKPLFSGLERCHFHPAYLKKEHKGVGGMYRLYKELKALNLFTAIADLHGVLRSFNLRLFFGFAGIPIAAIDKGRKEKKLLTRRENKHLVQLPTSFERYAVVFRNLGYTCALKTDEAIFSKQPLPAAAMDFFAGKGKVIGIAPFAQHLQKMYPIQRMKHVVKALSAAGHSILLLGGGEQEIEELQQWQNEIKGSVFNLAGKFSFAEELAIISNLTQMLSMDSANMHLASLYAVPVISIWGATHPFAGFYGWAQPIENIISIDIYCRPCSTFGNKPCYRGDFACMMQIEENTIIDKINKL
ncbi:glycosyltransferase family 9 protein [Ferruginibacter sp.]|uniref:glycosyltransferase family 9 protein n=1 Tax=Ferruginibacter sp. TaxID=1940288 RepID=UPI00374CA5D2